MPRKQGAGPIRTTSDRPPPTRACGAVMASSSTSIARATCRRDGETRRRPGAAVPATDAPARRGHMRQASRRRVGIRCRAGRPDARRRPWTNRSRCPGTARHGAACDTPLPDGPGGHTRRRGAPPVVGTKVVPAGVRVVSEAGGRPSRMIGGIRWSATSLASLAHPRPAGSFRPLRRISSARSASASKDTPRRRTASGILIGPPGPTTRSPLLRNPSRWKLRSDASLLQ